MANLKHLSLIKQGSEVWNRGLKEDAMIRPNLTGADLFGADLWEAILIQADLRVADLEGADLRGACLWEADLRWSNLGGGLLCRCDLSKARLEGANLYGTDFYEADLREADLRDVKNLIAEQLYDVKTLYRTLMDPELKYHLMNSCPHLFERPEDDG